jgi:3-oxoacyl-[acyl-carrier-protein] synthase II
LRALQRDVAVTGIGAVCAVGGDCRALWESVRSGRDGIGQIARFSTDAFNVHTGAEVRAWDLPAMDSRTQAEALCRGFAEMAGREAWNDSRIADAGVAPERIGVVFGTGLGDLAHPSHMLAEYLADTLGCQGPRITVSTACSSSTGALGIARDLILMGAADVMIAGGADVLTPEVFAGFHALGVLTADKCAPFSYPVGTTLGEGAGFVILERGDLARERGAERTVSLAGFGLSGDAYHETSPEPRGAGVERAIRLALADAEVSPAEIGYVNAHGSGTMANDASEWQGIQRGLGARARSVPVSSSKGALGHGQGAAGVLEAIVTILAHRHGQVPPTLNFAGARPQAPPDPVPGPRPRSHPWHHALCLNSAFGGSNAALLLSSGERRAAPRTLRPVYVLGTGVVGPWGLGNAAFLDAARNGRARGRPVPPFVIEHLVPSADPRGLDPLSRFLTAACALALGDADVTVRGSLRNRTGLIAGIVRPSATSLTEFARSLEERGLTGISASAFARIVLNAAPGFASKLLSLRGPLTTVTTGAGGGLVAILCASELLATRSDVDLMLAGGADEGRPANDTDRGALVEGAACVLLSGAPPARGGAPGVCIAGWGIAGPGRLADAIAQVASDDPDPAPTVWTYRAGDWNAGAAGSALACAEAVLALRNGETDRALVTSDEGRSASVALLLSARGG